MVSSPRVWSSAQNVPPPQQDVHLKGGVYPLEKEEHQPLLNNTAGRSSYPRKNSMPTEGMNHHQGFVGEINIIIPVGTRKRTKQAQLLETYH